MNDPTHRLDPTAAPDQLSAALLAWTSESAPQGIFTTDTELRLTSWNHWLETHARLERDRVLGKPLVDIIPSLVERRLDHCYRDALRGEGKLLSRSLHGYLLPLPPTVPSNWFTHMQQSARIGPLVLAGRICGTVTVIEDVTEREWHHRIVRQARQRTELLTGTLAHLLTARNPDELVRDIFFQIAGPLRLDCCLHHVLDSRHQRFQFHAADGLAAPETRGCALLEVAQALCATVLQSRERLVLDRLQEQTHPEVRSCKELGLTAFAGFPLLVGERLLGSLAFGSRRRTSLCQDDIQFLLTLSQYVAIALDRAQQEDKLRLSEERFRNMAATVPDIIFTAAPDGSRDYVNSRFYELTGLAPDRGLGFDWLQAVDPEDVERVRRAWQRGAETGEPHSLEYRMRDPQGCARWFYAQAQPIFDDARKLTKWYGTVTDIQPLKQAHNALALAQSQLAEHAASLEQAVEERTAELRQSVQQLESFSHTVAHDLRAPIRSLENYAHVLLEDYEDRLEDQAKAILTNMGRAAHRLDALTRDVLNYTKTATQRIELTPVDPIEILQDLLVLNPSLQTPNAEVAIVRPIPCVMAHSTLLSQCFSNLLSNAVKFVKPGVIPHIVIGSEPVSNNPAGPPLCGHGTAGPARTPPAATARVRLWIQDNGIGIAPEMRAKAFGVFERGRGLSHIPGTGIGLAIVAKAVERMQGACGVDSPEGEGSRFWLELTAA